MSKSFLDKLIERRDAVKAEMDAVLEAVAEENRTDATRKTLPAYSAALTGMDLSPPSSARRILTASSPV